MKFKWKPGISKKHISLFALPLIVLLVFCLYLFRLVDFHEEDTIDLRFRLRGAQKAHPAITVVVVDDQSLSAFGQWPWPRSIHAAFLGVLIRYRPERVFFDMIFTEAGPKPEDDDLFSLAVKKSGDVILPFFYRSLEPFEAQFPIPELMDALKETGFVNAVEDHDGHIRRAKAVIHTPRGAFYSPSVLMAAAHDHKKDPLQDVDRDSEDDLWINFPGPMASFRVVSYGEVISMTGNKKDQARLQDLFENRLVLVGHMATGTTDLKATPFSNRTPGVFVHASTLHTLLMRRHLRTISQPLHFLLLLLLGFLSSLVYKKLTPAKGFGAMAIIQILYFLLNLAVFVWGGLILPLIVPLTVIFIGYIGSLFTKYAEIYLQKEMSQRELAMAARIQEQFLPQAKPKNELFEIAFETRFTKTVGGDLYDWVDLGEGRLGFCVGDVSGKGMPAAIYMAKTMSDFRSIRKQDRNAGEVCEELNRVLIESPASGMFLTLLYAVIHPDKKILEFASAGHEFALFFRKQAGKAEVLKSGQGMPLGMFEGAYETSSTPYASGDSILLYSDGVKELRNAKGQEYGIEALLKRFEEAAVQDMNPEEIIRSLFTNMQIHQGKLQAHDDRTLLCVRFI